MRYVSVIDFKLEREMEKEDLGQLFIVGFDGCSVKSDHPIVHSIENDNIGGVILFDHNVDGSRQNISSPAQLKELTETLQQYARIPLLVTVDQEGGRICRLKENDGFSASVSAKWLGGKDDEEITRFWAKKAAKELAASGVNLNFAPVVDLDLNLENPIISRYERSFGSACEIVVKHALIYIEEHHRCGISCCLKHFPGHGSSGSDSHLGFVDVTESWQEKELEPYRELFALGFSDAVMSAHVVNKKIDSTGKPATLSKDVLHKLLRDKLGFSGVIVSDDLQMRAITDYWGFDDAVQCAILAGVDLIVIGNNLVRDTNVVQRGVEVVWTLLEDGRMKEDDLQRSLDRIAVLKQKNAGSLSW